MFRICLRPYIRILYIHVPCIHRYTTTTRCAFSQQEHHVYSTIWRPHHVICHHSQRSDTWQRPEDAKGGIGGALGSLQLSHLAQARSFPSYHRNSHVTTMSQLSHSESLILKSYWILMNIEYIVHVHALSCKNASTFRILQGPRPDPQRFPSAPIGTVQLCKHGLVCWQDVCIYIYIHISR